MDLRVGCLCFCSVSNRAENDVRGASNLFCDFTLNSTPLHLNLAEVKSEWVLAMEGADRQH